MKMTRPANLNLFRPRTGNPLIEGLRLASFNFLYIVTSISLFLAVIYGYSYLYSSFARLIPSSVHTTNVFLNNIYMLVALLVVLFSAVFYLILWGWFTNGFYRLIVHTPKPKRKFFLLGVLGALPNFALWLGFSTWAQLLPGANDDSCGGFFLFALLYLAFLVTSFVMPFFGWFHLISAKPNVQEQ
ncbi:MAG: hypothetical protein ACXVPK_03335 [Tumebacillaceae bacterium]